MLRHLIWFLGLSLFLSACSLTGSDSGLLPSPADPTLLRVEATGSGVTVVRNNVRESLADGEVSELNLTDRLVVEGLGRATVQRDALLTVELLQPGELTLQTLAEVGQFTEIDLAQSSGVALYSFNLNKTVDHQLTLETKFATITSTEARFLVGQGGDNLEWIINLGQAADTLQVTANGVTESVSSGTARWLIFNQPPSEARSIDTGQLESWLAGLRVGQPSPTLNDLLFEPADLIGQMANLTTLPALDQPFTVGAGQVTLTLDRLGLFGNPTYLLEDCDGDGSQEIRIEAGQVQFDFSEVLAQTQALDVTVINRSLPGNGALWGADADQNELARQLVGGGEGVAQTLSLRASQSFHSARLALVDGCLVGFSLTPPGSNDLAAPPRPIATVAPPSGVIVNVLATPEEEGDAPAAGVEADNPPREQTPLLALSLAGRPNGLEIDGDPADWAALAGGDGAWTRFATPVYDNGCANRFPGREALIDLSGQVRFAYDADFLYVAFQIEDDGYVGYSGLEQQYFLGDSPQLSLDMDLLGDYTDSGRSDDDWQIDFSPEPSAPRAVLWQLAALSSRNFEEARVASSFSGANYFLEAALPWRSLGATPQPGDQIGLAANVNDNDTPATNAQECIISTAPRREWNNPTTWSILVLQPPTE